MPEKALAAEEPAWRQCDLLPSGYSQSLIEAGVDLKPEFHPGKTLLCIISQDCDIVAEVNKEPFVDIIAGNLIRKVSGEFINTRNPRCLHMEAAIGPLSFSIHDKFRIPKGALRGIIREEDNQFSFEQRDILKRWVGRRYLRSAFPDTLNHRLNKGTIKDLEKSLLAEDVTVILLSTTDDELPDDSEYHLKVILGIRDGLPEERIDEIEKAFEAALSPAGIVVDDIRLSDEDDITYRNLRTYKRLEKDYRSLPDDGNAALPPAALDGL
jgi:hypothetical protein